MFAERLSPAQREIARQVFFRLTEPGEGTEDTRRRASLEDLVPQPERRAAVATVVNVLTEERLLTTSDGSVEVAHEALIRHWPTLRGWLDEDRAGLLIQHRLAEAAAEWERLDRDDSALYRGGRLAGAVEWLAQHPTSANERERKFVKAGVAARDRERRRSGTRIAAIGLVLLVASIAATIAAVIAVGEQHVAESRAIALEAENQLPLNPPAVANTRTSLDAAMTKRPSSLNVATPSDCWSAADCRVATRWPLGTSQTST